MSKRARGVYSARVGAALLAADMLYLELMLRITTQQPFFSAGVPGGLCTALSAALLFGALCCLIRGEKRAWRAEVIVCAVMTVWFLFCCLTYDAYKVFMPPDIIVSQAGNAARDFGGNVVSTVIKSLPIILLYFVPLVAAVVLARIAPRGAHARMRARGRLPLHLGLGAVAALVRSALPSGDKSTAEFSSSVALSPAPTAEPDPAAPVDSDEPEDMDYGENIMDIDFDAHETSKAKLKSLGEYVQSIEPTKKNKYTGMFEGKNLILITAEAFSKEVIDPDRTPTLYRLATRGIVFEDFYQPAWGGSTSTGEYSFLTGLAPMDAMVMMSSRSANMCFTMGNQLKRLGYNSFGYHNGNYNYYSRNLTVPNMGYDSFVGIGNGMENGLTGGLFPESDKEMMDYTVPLYIDSQPFSVYYMTISGHASYSFKDGINDMSAKNRAVTENLPYSEPIQAYLAANMELEYALDSLITQLETAGIADDTVIAIVPDHYPYGLLPSNAWGGQTGLLEELYGHPSDTCQQRDHNAAIIWCGELEKDEPITVSVPVSSIDILPTLSNLFGVEYDSRLLAGRDALSEQAGLVFWNDSCWVTEKGYYNTHERTFYSAEGESADEAYIEQMKAVVADRLNLSRIIENEDYYGFLFGKSK